MLASLSSCVLRKNMEVSSFSSQWKIDCHFAFRNRLQMWTSQSRMPIKLQAKFEQVRKLHFWRKRVKKKHTCTRKIKNHSCVKTFFSQSSRTVNFSSTRLLSNECDLTLNCWKSANMCLHNHSNNVAVVVILCTPSGNKRSVHDPNNSLTSYDTNGCMSIWRHHINTYSEQESLTQKSKNFFFEQEDIFFARIRKNVAPRNRSCNKQL